MHENIYPVMCVYYYIFIKMKINKYDWNLWLNCFALCFPFALCTSFSDIYSCIEYYENFHYLFNFKQYPTENLNLDI